MSAKKRPFPPRRVTVAVDLTAPSRAAVETAAFLARRWGALLEILHVEVARERAPLAGAYWWPWADFRAWRTDVLRRWLKGFPERRVRVHALPGWPPTVLSALTRRGGPPLLVIGTHGYSGLERVLFGSVAEAAVRRARVPVLVVHEGRPLKRVRTVVALGNGGPPPPSTLREARRWAGVFGARLESPADESRARAADLRVTSRAGAARSIRRGRAPALAVP